MLKCLVDLWHYRVVWCRVRLTFANHPLDWGILLTNHMQVSILAKYRNSHNSKHIAIFTNTREDKQLTRDSQLPERQPSSSTGI